MDIDFNVIASMLYISISSACICGLNGNCIVGTVMLYVEKETTKWFIHIGVLTTRNQTEYIFFVNLNIPIINQIGWIQILDGENIDTNNIFINAIWKCKSTKTWIKDILLIHVRY